MEDTGLEAPVGPSTRLENMIHDLIGGSRTRAVPPTLACPSIPVHELRADTVARFLSLDAEG